MLNVESREENGAQLIILSGTINEDTNLLESCPVDRKQVIFDCGKVQRINSVGVKNWIQFMKHLSQEGISVTLRECSVSLVEQINMIKDFIPSSAKIESVQLPYYSSDLDQDFTKTFTLDALKASFPNPPAAMDENGKEAEFDDIPEEYLAFIKARS